MQEVIQRCSHCGQPFASHLASCPHCHVKRLDSSEDSQDEEQSGDSTVLADVRGLWRDSALPTATPAPPSQTPAQPAASSTRSGPKYTLSRNDGSGAIDATMDGVRASQHHSSPRVVVPQAVVAPIHNTPSYTPQAAMAPIPNAPSQQLLSVEMKSGEIFSLIGQRIGNFQIIEQIGSGGFGSVYLAEQIFLKKPFAVKVLHVERKNNEQMSQRFLREAQVLAELDHPNIVKSYDFGVLEPFGYYLVMEYVEGLGLLPWLESVGRSASRVRDAMQQMCAALDHIHQQKLLHRDLKPGNILVQRLPNGSSNIKILDFGIAALVESNSELTGSGNFLGTAQYASPEQIEGRKDVDARSDLYSLGIILYYMLAGRLPFENDSHLAIIMMQLTKEPPLLQETVPQIPWAKELEAFVRRALAKSPAERPASASQFWQECQQALDAQERLRPLLVSERLQQNIATGQLHPLDSDEQKSPAKSLKSTASPQHTVMLTVSPRSRRPVLWGLLAVMLVLVGVGAVWYFQFFSAPHTPGIAGGDGDPTSPNAPRGADGGSQDPNAANTLKWAMLYLSSSPQGATIVVDGQQMGQTPRSVRLQAGKLHDIALQKPGFEKAKLRWSGQDNETRTVALVPIPEPKQPSAQDETPQPAKRRGIAAKRRGVAAKRRRNQVLRRQKKQSSRKGEGRPTPPRKRNLFDVVDEPI